MYFRYKRIAYGRKNALKNSAHKIVKKLSCPKGKAKTYCAMKKRWIEISDKDGKWFGYTCYCIINCVLAYFEYVEVSVFGV